MDQSDAASRTETPDALLHLSIPRPRGPVPGRPRVSVRRRSRGAARGPSPGRRARIPMLELRGLGGRAPGHDLALATDRLSALTGEAPAGVPWSKTASGASAWTSTLLVTRGSSPQDLET